MNIIEIRRGSGSWESSTAVPNSLPFEVSGRTGSTRVTIKPAPPGVGLVTNQVGQIMLRLAGVDLAPRYVILDNIQHSLIGVILRYDHTVVDPVQAHKPHRLLNLGFDIDLPSDSHHGPAHSCLTPFTILWKSP
jgi:hypothetical protein